MSGREYAATARVRRLPLKHLFLPATLTFDGAAAPPVWALVEQCRLPCDQGNERGRRRIPWVDRERCACPVAVYPTADASSTSASLSSL